MNEYVIIPKNEIDIKKSETIITGSDAEELLEYKDIFIKFLNKSRFSYQIELSKGTFRGQEEKLYRSIETIDELKKGLESIEKGFKVYNNNLQNINN